ncbi:MAG TPA: methyltransferase [Solirubrobacteraceae bacterium]|jgi:hypothetical protein
MPLPEIVPPYPVIQAALRLRGRLLDLVDRMLPAEGALWDLTAGLQRAKLAGALVDSGLADALGEGWQRVDELARELELEPQVTFRVLRAAAAARLVRLRGERARLSRIGAPLARSHSASIASWASYLAAPANARGYEQLTAQLAAGAEPSGHRRAFGDSIWEYLAEHPAQEARFAAAMREMTAIDVPALARAYPWPDSGVICDVAGGIGTLLAAILARRPAARGILLDAPEVLAQAEAFLAARGLAGQVERRPGNLFGELDARAELYILKWILHDWSDAACVGILRRLRASMPSGSRVLVIDQHQEPTVPSPITSMVDLHMLVECEGGRERSPAEVHELMREAGLQPGPVRHAGLHMLVEGRAP